MPRTNETRYIEWHETCKCECKFGENVWIKHLFGILVIVSVNIMWYW